MQNDSIETLLSRHYGATAPTPPDLEQRLLTALQHEVRVIRPQHVTMHRVNRRRAVQLVALGSAGLGLLSIGMEGLQLLESAVANQEAIQSAFP